MCIPKQQFRCSVFRSHKSLIVWCFPADLDQVNMEVVHHWLKEFIVAGSPAPPLTWPKKWSMARFTLGFHESQLIEKRHVGYRYSTESHGAGIKSSLLHSFSVPFGFILGLVVLILALFDFHELYYPSRHSLVQNIVNGHAAIWIAHLMYSVIHVFC